MEIEGKIIAAFPIQSGIAKTTGKSWQSQEYLIETMGQFPHKCCFKVFGEEKIKTLAIREGEEMTVSFDIDAHEYNGRWFNNLTAWAVRRKDLMAPGSMNKQSEQPAYISDEEPPF